MIDLMIALWTGRIPLPKTYWVYGALVLAPPTVTLLAIEAFTGKPASPRYLVPAFLIGMLLRAYWIFISVAIWRSAGNYTGRIIWGALARMAVVFGYLRLTLELLKK
jgi:hypothetical protein